MIVTHKALPLHIGSIVERIAIEETLEAIQEPEGDSSQKPIRNPVVEAEVNKIEQEIETQTKTQTDLKSQIQYHASQLRQAPIFEQQISGLMRDYDALQTHYNQLQEKKLSAEMASELETKEAGERFVVLDAAIPPVRPYAPNRAFIIGVGFVLGILSGIGVAVLVEMSDESVRHEREAG